MSHFQRTSWEKATNTRKPLISLRSGLGQPRITRTTPTDRSVKVHTTLPKVYRYRHCSVYLDDFFPVFQASAVAHHLEGCNATIQEACSKHTVINQTQFDSLDECKITMLAFKNRSKACQVILLYHPFLST